MHLTAEYNRIDQVLGHYGGNMDEIEQIFPEESSAVAGSAPAEDNAQRAHKAITDHCLSLRHSEERLQEDLLGVQEKRAPFDELHRYLRERSHEKWPLHVIDWFSRNEGLVRGIDRSGKGKLPGAMKRILQEATQDAEELKKRHSFWMDTTAAKRKFKPDPTSRHPTYRFRDGFFTVVVSEPSFTAHIETLAGLLRERMPADPDAVIGYLLGEKSRIFDRPFDAEALLRRLLRNYLAIVERDASIKPGEPIPIRRIMGRLRDNEKEFRNDEFLVDLTRLLDSHVSSVDGQTLVLEQTKDVERGLYVFPKYGKGYVGFLRFMRRD
jgi:hypothetical protein